MIIFVGTRGADGAAVHIEDRAGARRPLPLRLDLVGHSPTGFEWGYGGSGPAQLALAILAIVVGDADALANYQAFKCDVVFGLPHEGWRLEEPTVRDWLSRQARALP